MRSKPLPAAWACRSRSRQETGPSWCAAAPPPWTSSSTDGAIPFGTLGLLNPRIGAAHDLPAQAELYVAELDLDAPLPAMQFDRILPVLSPPRHPAIVRDISIVVDDTLLATKVRDTIRSAAPATLVRVREFDRYQGKGVADGRVSLSYRLTFQAADRTLTDAEVQRAMDEILQELGRAHGAVSDSH